MKSRSSSRSAVTVGSRRPPETSTLICTSEKRQARCAPENRLVVAKRSCTRSPSKESGRCVKAPWKNGHPSKVCSRSLTTYWNVPHRPLLRKPLAIGRSKNTSLPKWGALEGKNERRHTHERNC